LSCNNGYFLASDSDGIKCKACSNANSKAHGCYNADSGKNTGCLIRAFLDTDGVCKACTDTNALAC